MSDLPAANAAGSTRARKAAPIAKIFVSDQDSEGVIRQSLSDLGIDDAEFTKGTVETATADLATKASPNLLFVDLSGIEDPVARIHELAERCEPSVSVVAIGNRNDIVLYRDLKNAGVSEYFYKPLIIDLVKATCNSVLSGGGARTIDGSTHRQARLRARRARRRRSHHDRGQRGLVFGREKAALGHACRSRPAEW